MRTTRDRLSRIKSCVPPYGGGFIVFAATVVFIGTVMMTAGAQPPNPPATPAPPPDAVQQAQQPSPTSAKRPEQVKTDHDRSGVSSERYIQCARCG